MGYWLDCRNWIGIYLGWYLAIGSLVARLNDAWWAKPSVCFWDMIWMWFDCVLDFRFLVSVYACTLVLATCIWYLAICIWQWFLVLSWSISLLGSTCAFCFDTWSFSYIPASSRYCIFQLQVHLYFHFQLDFLLPVLVFDKGSPVMFCSSPRCNAD